jgi:hypothetical protein
MSLIISTFVLILSNLIGLYITIAASPSVVTLWLMYWTENVSIGFFNVLKMKTLVRLHIDTPENGKFYIPFFALHYGLFTFVHGIFLITFAFISKQHEVSFSIVGVNALILFASHAFSFWVNFLKGGEYKTAKIESLFLSPYPRVIAMHLVVILGGILVFNQKNQVPGIILLGICKLGADLISHLAHHHVFTRK